MSKLLTHTRRLGRIALRVLPLAALLGAGSASALQINEFRVRGPNGANDEYIQVINETAVAVTVAASGGTGFAIAASDGVVRCTIPDGTVIPARGAYLCANSVGYSISGNPTGAADATYTTDIPDNAGIALFNNNLGGGSFTLANRIDAVGSTSEANTLYREGAGYPALTPFSIDYAFTRDRCGKGGSIANFAACSGSGVPLDTNNNSADFVFVDTNGTSAGAGQRLGAPGPSNLAGPVGGTVITNAVFDNCAATTAGPNTVYDGTSVPAQNSTFGTIDIRRTFTNTSGLPLTSLRFRVVDITTFPAPSGVADLRPRTSTNLAVTVDRTPCGATTSSVTVAGTTLDQPPSQPNGGGFNSTLSVPAVSPGTPLAAGASIDVRFLLGIQQTGSSRFAVLAEGLPVGGTLFQFSGCAGVTCPTVSSIVRASPSPSAANTVTYTVTFNQSVTGVDPSDFALAATGVAGAAITTVTGAGTTYTVTVNTGTGNGTIGLNLVDDDSVVSGGVALGGAGAGNGNFTGEVYTITRAVVSGTTSIPTLSEWGLILMSLLMGLMAWRFQRNRG